MRFRRPSKKAVGVALTMLGMAAFTAGSSGRRSQFIGLARLQKGKPYIWGATGPETFDCSGLTQWCYAQMGISVPRQVTEQAQNAPRRIDVASVGGWQAAKAMLKPGDCVGMDYDPGGRFDHVAIWTGASWIHASGGEACPNHPTSRCKVVEDSPAKFGSSCREIYSYIVP